MTPPPVFEGAAHTRRTEPALPFAERRIGADANAAGIAFTYAYEPLPDVESAVTRKKY